MKICLLGRTETNKVVIFEGDDSLIDQTIDVQIIKDHLWYLEGKFVK
ncbi:MAG: TRAM domain-containing protein [Clostridia bacterium]|nr:TRAM domain-containing protein [Clostridia bacterium]